MAQDVKSGPLHGPVDRLKTEAVSLVGAVGDRAVASLRGKVEDAAGRLTDYVEGGAGPGLMAAVTGAKNLAEGKGPVRSLLGAGATAAKQKLGDMVGHGGGHGKNLKVTSIVESIDVGVPVALAYNQWTQFADFPSFMKKVESVEQVEDQKLNWKAQVFWSHRTWESTILEQAPDDKIVWRSKGAKGYVDGAVTFHELAPNMTRILLGLEYHPQGFFEHTGNLWRAPGRRARLEFKHFRRHLMAEAILHPDEIEGWRGVIHDGEVVQDHEPASAEENGERTDPEYSEDIGREYEDEDDGHGKSDGRRPARGGADTPARAPARSRRTDRRPGRPERSGADDDRPRRALRRGGVGGGDTS